MAGFAEVPHVGPDDEAMKKAEAMTAGLGLELAPLEGQRDGVAQSEVAQSEVGEVARVAVHQAEADAAAAEKLATQIKEGGISTTEVVEDGGSEPEGIYGMNLADLRALVLEEPAIFRDGYAGGVDSPDWSRKIKEKQDAIQASERAEVKLFDRVLNGQASEEEMQIAIAKATKLAETYGLDGFHSAIPKAWYTNERIAEAMANTSPASRRWVEYVKKQYPNEELKKQYRVIEEDGSVGTYQRQ